MFSVLSEGETAAQLHLRIANVGSVPNALGSLTLLNAPAPLEILRLKYGHTNYVSFFLLIFPFYRLEEAAGDLNNNRLHGAAGYWREDRETETIIQRRSEPQFYPYLAVQSEGCQNQVRMKWCKDFMEELNSKPSDRND